MVSVGVEGFLEICFAFVLLCPYYYHSPCKVICGACLVVDEQISPLGVVLGHVAASPSL